MQLEDYIDIQGPLQVRLGGHRIGIEIILGDYLEEGLSAEEIVWQRLYQLVREHRETYRVGP